MRKKLSKILSVILTLALVTSCIVVSDFSASADTVEYWVINGGTGDGRTVDTPAASVSAVIETINKDNPANAIVYIKQRSDYNYQINQGYHYMTYWAEYNAADVSEHTASITVKPYDTSVTTYLVFSSLLGKNQQLRLGGPTTFEGVTLVSPRKTETQIASRGFNLTFASDVKFAIYDSFYQPAASDTATEFSITSKTALPVQTDVYNGTKEIPEDYNLVVNNAFVTGSDGTENLTSIIIGGYFSTYTYKKDLNVTFNNADILAGVYMGSGHANGTYTATVEGNINFNVKNANQVVLQANKNPLVANAFQAIISNGTISGAVEEFANVTLTKGAYYLYNQTGVEDVLSFTDTAGTFAVNGNYSIKAIKDGTNEEIFPSNNQLVLPAGSYTIVENRDKIVKDYYVMSSGHDNTNTNGDGRTQSAPAEFVADVIETITKDGLSTGDIANVYILQDSDGLVAAPNATTIEGTKTGYKHNYTAFANLGGVMPEHTFTLVLKSPDNQNNALAYSSYIGYNAHLYLGGPTVFENVTLVATRTYLDRPVIINGQNVTFGSETDFRGFKASSPGGNSLTLDNADMPIQFTKDSNKTFPNEINLNLNNAYDYSQNAGQGKKVGLHIPSLESAANTVFDKDVNITVNNAAAKWQFTFGSCRNKDTDTADRTVTFSKALNIDVKAVSEIKFGAGKNAGGTGKVVANGGIQVLLPNSTATIEDFAEQFTAKEIENFFILKNGTNNADLLSFVEDENGDTVVGKFNVDSETVLSAVDESGNEVARTSNGVLDLTGKPGTYTIKRISAMDYYVRSPGAETITGVSYSKGLGTLESPAATVADVVDIIKKDGLGFGDTANVYILQDTDGETIQSSSADSEVGFYKHNLTAWADKGGAVPDHEFTMVIKSPENQNNKLTYSSWVGYNAYFILGGPTKFENVTLVSTVAYHNRAISANGHDLSLGTDTAFAHIYKFYQSGNVSDWDGTLRYDHMPVQLSSASATYKDKVNVELNNAYDYTKNAGQTKNTGLHIASIDSTTSVEFEKDVNVTINNANAKWQLTLGGTSPNTVTFNKSLNINVKAASEVKIGVGKNEATGTLTATNGIQIIIPSATTVTGDFEAEFAAKNITNYYLLKSNNAGYISFAENANGETIVGKYNIIEGYNAIAKDSNGTTVATSVEGVLNLVGKPGVYTISFTTEPVRTDNYKDFIDYRGYNTSVSNNNGALANTYYKLINDKELNVVYFGGSVTAGSGSETGTGCWRERIGAWLVENFPDATINNINKAIGETGTYLGSFRVTRDIVSSAPDLLFLEYSINDYYDGASYDRAATQYETIVRKVKEVYPDCDIVTVLVTDRGQANSASNGTLHSQARAHFDIAKEYNIPTLRVGSAIGVHLKNEGWVYDKNVANADDTKWLEYFKDIVHPLDKGYDVYFQVVREFMNNTLVFGEYTSAALQNQTLPEIVNKYLSDGNITFIDDDDENVSFTSGATHDKTSNGIIVGDYLGRIKFTGGSDDTVTVKFNGTELVMTAVSGDTKTNTYIISLDGGKTWSDPMNYTDKNPITIVKGLTTGEHTVTIKPAGVSDVLIDGFFSRDVSKATNKVKLFDLVALNDSLSNTTVDYRDYDNNGAIGDGDLVAVKTMLLNEWEEAPVLDTSHIKPIARLGYRPYTGTYPQQSIESYKQAYDVGHRIMLADVRITSDGYMVCCHDDDISKVNAKDANGVKVTQGQVLISQTTLADLLTYDFSNGKGSIIPLPVLQFEDFMEFCATYKSDITPCLELKVDMTETQIDYIASLVKQYGFEDEIMFVASHNNSLIIAPKLPNCTIGRWVYSFSNSTIDQMAAYNVKGTFIYVGKEGKKGDAINLKAYEYASRKGVDFGFTYISNNDRALFDELKNKCVFNYCKYIGLDEVSWLKE